jgi:mevalonate pyrophosphate decarboxylase
MILMTPDSLRVIELVRQMRRTGIEAYFSMQTGPTVYVNTLPEHIDEVVQSLREAGFEVMVSKIGEGAELISP